MEMATKNAGAKTPVKDSHGSRSRNRESPKLAENFNPNVSHNKSPRPNPSASKNPNNPVHNKIRERKFVVTKKNPKKNSQVEGGDAGSTASFCKCKEEKDGGKDAKKKNKCFCVAYENLRKSQEDFFKNRRDGEELGNVGATAAAAAAEEGCSSANELGNSNCDLTVKRRRESVTQNGSGKVMHLVKAFEKLLCSKGEDSKEGKEPEEENNNNGNNNNKKVIKWELPVLQFPASLETEVSGSSFCPPQLILTSENLGLDPRASVSSSWDSSCGSVSSKTSTGGRRSRRNSLESSSTFGGRRWKKKQLRVTSQKPFKLRTEQRGKLKEEEFEKKIQEMMTEEEKQRIPVAQGLPLTTDEPECLLKPPVKEGTRPIDLTLHSDVRAMDRADFDHQMAEKLILIEQYKLERERQKMLAEDEEVRRLRKELIPKAQPMPYFDRPFIPRRSVKHPTMPREPKLHSPHQKKIKCSLSSWNDVNPCSSNLD